MSLAFPSGAKKKKKNYDDSLVSLGELRFPAEITCRGLVLSEFRVNRLIRRLVRAAAMLCSRICALFDRRFRARQLSILIHQLSRLAFFAEAEPTIMMAKIMIMMSLGRDRVCQFTEGESKSFTK